MKATKPHVYVFPFPVQSHINPMLDFSKSLASNDLLNVTFIMTRKTSNSPSNIDHNISIEYISDGSDEVQEPQSTSTSTSPADNIFQRFESVVSRNLVRFLEQQKESRCSTLVYDSVFPWALDVARKTNMIGAPFFTQSCAAIAIYYHIKEGSLRYPFEEGCGRVMGLPEFLPALGIDDMPALSKVAGSDEQTLLRILVDQFRNLDEADLLLFNTFHKLETEVVEWMATRWPIKTIGPTNSLAHKNKQAVNLFESNQEACTKWLDSKEINSVIYVSFGSLASLDEPQMEELAMGLTMSQCNFLWVVRASEEHKLPTNFMASLSSEKGLVVGWCSQAQVLAHRSVSCFLTHAGWNSTMEGLSSGVPLVAMPLFVDQMTNAKFVEDVWRVGVRVSGGENGKASREEVCKCVKEVAGGERGNELGKNSKKWKELAKEAVDDGGTTAKNIDDITSLFLGVQAQEYD